MEEKNTERKSEFNEAALKMKRLSELQTHANYEQLNGNFNNWFKALCGLFKEVIGKLKETEKEECRKAIHDISKKIRQKSQFKGFPEPYGYILSTPKIKNRNLESLLFDFDCRLRELIDSHGFGSPEMEDSLF